MSKYTISGQNYQLKHYTVNYLNGIMDQGNINEKTFSNNCTIKPESIKDKIIVSNEQIENPLKVIVEDHTKEAPFTSSKVSSNNKVLHCSDYEDGQKSLVISESKSPGKHLKVSVNEEENMVIQKQQDSYFNDVKSFTGSNKYKTKSRKSEFCVFLFFFLKYCLLFFLYLKN